MASLIITRARKGVFLLLLLLVWSEAAVAAVAGSLDFVAGDVRIRSAEGVERVARKGDPVNVGDHVITGALSNAQLRMIDKAYLAVRPESELDIKDYRYSERSDGNENALLSLVRGTMRAFTGSITRLKREKFVMVTPTATIGIRGSGNVLHFSPNLGTLNHTIEGSHAVSSVNQQGQVLGTIVTSPGQTVQVFQNQPPVRVPTPPFLLQAATSQPRAPGQGQQGQQQRQGGGQGQQGQQGGSGDSRGQQSGGSGDSGGGETGGTTAARATAAPDTALTSAASTVSTPVTTTGTTTASALPAPATTTNLTGTSATGQVNTSTQIVTTPTGQTVPLTNVAVVLDPSLNYGHNFLATKAAGGGFESVIGDVGNSTGFAGSNYVFSGNALTDIRSADAIDAFGLTYVDTTTSFFGPGARYVKFVGGAAQDAFALVNNSAVLGRWQGGTVNIYSDPGATGGTSLLESIPLGNRSASWIVFQQPPANFAVPLTGTSTYSLLAATRPTDSLGNVGTLNSASLSANFSAQTARASLNLGIAARSLTLDAKTPIMAMKPGNAGFGSAFIPCTAATCPTSLPLISASLSSGIGTLTCTGTGCPSSGYLGFLQGGFGGSTATGPGAGFTYSFQSFTTPTTTTAQTPFDDVIQGVAVFQAGTAPPVGVSPTAVGSTGKFLTQAVYPVFGAGGAGFAGVDRTTTSSGSLSSSAFLLDASGNLVRVTGAAWNVSDRGTNTQCLLGAPCLLSTTPTSPSPDTSAMFSMGGGVIGAKGSTFNANGDFTGASAAESYFDSTTGTRFGRYAGGVVNAASLAPASSTSGPLNVITNLGSNSVIWAVREVPASIPLTGTYHYLPQFATAPVDTLGNVGTLNSARLDVDFSRQVVDPGVRITINNQTISGNAHEVPLSSTFSFNVTTSSTENALLSPAPPNRIGTSCFGVTCPQPPVGVALSKASGGTGSGYGARFTGGLSGDGTAKGAFLAYTFNTFYDTTLMPGSGLPNSAPVGVVANNYISGYVGLGKGPQFQPPATPGSEVLAAYFYWPGGTLLSNPFGINDEKRTTRFSALASGVTTDGSGNLTAVTDSKPDTTTPTALKITGGTLPGSVTTTTNGISFGRYSGQTVAQGQAGTGTVLSLAGNENFSNNGGPFGPPSTTPARNVVGSLQWIKGPELWPFLLAETLTGSVSFSLIGNSPPTDQNGVAGTLGGATLNVNFSNQSVNAALSNIVVPAANGSLNRTWNATANNLTLSNDGQFSAYDSSGANPLAHRSLSVTMTTPGTTTSPQPAFGDIQGTLTGAGANGAILAYTFGAFDSNNLSSHEHVNGTAAFVTSLTPTQIAQNLNEQYTIRLAANGMTAGVDATTGGVPPVPAGSIDDDYLAWISGGAVNHSRTVRNLQGQVIEFDGQVPVVTTNSGCTPTPSCLHNVNEISTRVSVNPSTANVTVGATTIPGVTGAASILDSGIDPTTGIYWGRYANGYLAQYDRITGAPIPGLVSVANGPHYIYTPAMNGPVVLPLTGSATYTLVGNTNPTDSVGAGHVGTLNSASLAANFSTQTVDTSVNATVAGTNIIGSGTSVPIQKGLFFEAHKPLSGTGNLSMSCSGGSCNPATMTGRVIGVFTGTTGQGAAMAYSLNTGGLPGQTISGVAAFKR